MGVAQGVFELCQNLHLQDLNIELHIFGDGAEKNQIQDLIDKNINSKIFFYGMLERSHLHLKLKSMDIAIVPLKTRIYGSVPSKIFEYGALGFPILYCGGGEGGKIVADNNLGWVATAGDYVELNNQIRTIAQLDQKEIFELKNKVFKTSKAVFDLDKQIRYLINEQVF